MAVLQKKQWARPIAPDGQIPHHGLHCAERAVAHASVDIHVGSVLEALILTNMQEGEDGQSTVTSLMVMCSAMEKLFKLRTVKTEARRKPN